MNLFGVNLSSPVNWSSASVAQLNSESLLPTPSQLASSKLKGGGKGEGTGGGVNLSTFNEDGETNKKDGQRQRRLPSSPDKEQSESNG